LQAGGAPARIRYRFPVHHHGRSDRVLAHPCDAFAFVGMWTSLLLSRQKRAAVHHWDMSDVSPKSLILQGISRSGRQ
jgi:hypothetical protein